MEADVDVDVDVDEDEDVDEGTATILLDTELAVNTFNELIVQ